MAPFLQPRRRPGRPYMAGAPLLFAHRGGAALAPENTMEAFRGAVHHWGADVLEMDVHLTADGVLVVIHDDTVDRTTNGSGPVADLTLSQLRELDAGHAFLDLEGTPSFRDRGVRVPTFQEVLDAFPRTRLNVDAKAPAAARPLQTLVREQGESHRVLLASVEEEGRADRFGYPGPVSATRRQLVRFHGLHRVPLLGRLWTPDTDALQVPWRWDGRQVTTPRLIREAHLRNLPVHVWTVDDPDIMRTLVRWGVDGIQTDRPDLLARILHEETGRPLPPGPG
ncbi:MAG: glycerophosphodiester phosphodiesterase [Gemmatimonadales bacterium]|nr:MAG: glycerophosphodiester phosphodiesterase [Gemmatimonadales bacterium]